MAKTIASELVVSYPRWNGDGWIILELTKSEAEHLRKALDLVLSSNGKDNPQAYAQ